MSRSDRSSSDVSAVPGLIALGALVGASGLAYARDLRAAIAQLLGKGLEEALRQERDRVKAELLALAVVADGEITEAERAAIHAFAARRGLPPEETLAKVAALGEQLRDPAVLRENVARSSALLSPGERLEVFVTVKNFAHRGSRAWPSEAGYRGARGPTPEGLIAIYREALGIEPIDGTR